MANEEMITLRVPNHLKARVREAARRENKSVSSYIKERLLADEKKGVENRHLYRKSAREALAKYIGGSRHGHTTENIDEVVYGKR